MALLNNYTLNGDFLITGAYLRIKSLTIEHNPSHPVCVAAGLKLVAIPTLEVKPARGKNRLDIWCAGDSWAFAYDHTSNVNLIKQAYAFLKTLPEFVGATDSAE